MCDFCRRVNPYLFSLNCCREVLWLFFVVVVEYTLPFHRP